MGFAQCRIDVAAANSVMAADIAAQHAAFTVLVFLPVWVHERRIRRECLVNTRDGSERLVLNLDGGGCGASAFFRVGGDCSHGLACITNVVNREQMLVLDPEVHRLAGDRAAICDGCDTGFARCVADVYALDAGELMW